MFLILERLPPPDLRSVCLTDRYLRQLAEPHLYSAVKLRFSQSQPPLIPSLVCTILRRPELAAHIRTLSCDGGHPSEWELLELEPVPNVAVRESDAQEAISFVEKFLGNIGLSFYGVWTEGLRRGTLESYLAVLLLQLPHLQRLDLGHAYFSESNLVGFVVRSILCGSHPGCCSSGINTSLHQLHTVCLERLWGASNRAIRNTENALPFFYLPALRKLSIPIDDPTAPELPWPTAHPPLARELTSLKVTQMRESHLGQLLSSASHLRSLHWEWRFEKALEDPFHTTVVNLDLLMPALRHARGTLTDLTIHARSVPAAPGHSNMAFGLSIQGSAAAFAGFDQLTKLFIPLAFFTGFWYPLQSQERLMDCLPRNLEDLTLTDDLFVDMGFLEEWDEVGLLSEVVAWLADLEATTPRLRKLCVVLMAEDDEVPPEVLDVRNEIRKLARGAGVEVMIEHAY